MAADTTTVESRDTITPCIKDTSKMTAVQLNDSREAKSLTPKHVRIASPPSTGSPASLIDDDVDSSRNSPSPNPTPSDRSPAQNQQNGRSSTERKDTGGPAPTHSSSHSTSAAASRVPTSSLKRKRRTPDQKKAEEEEKERKRKEKEQKKKEADEKRAKEEAEKLARAQERSEKRAKVEAEKNARAQEREAKRIKKEEEAQRAKEEKERKDRSQMKLASFFTVPSAASFKKSTKPDRDQAASKYEDDTESPRLAKKQATQSAYDKLFRPFYVKSDVRMAENAFPLGCAAREARSRMLDQHISAQPQSFTVGRFAAESFGFSKDPTPRGKLHKPVRRTIETMHELGKKAEATGSLEDQEAIRRQMREELAKVPMKYLCYREDVRPAYRGTITQTPAAVGKGTMRKLARRPNSRVMPVDYDYDSEAEWVDEEGEDVDLDDDDEEDIDDGEGVGDLIDDSEAVDLTRFAYGLEPESTGLCWEDSQFVGPEAKMHDYQVEFIFGDHLERNQSIDPLSTAYWPDAKSKTAERPTANGPSAAKAEKKAKGETAGAGIPAGIAHNDVAKIKRAIKAHVEAAPRISKVGLIEYLKSSAVDGIKVKGRDISAKDLKEVVETLAERRGKSKDVVWTIRPGYD
ncbi:hypothetical protein ACRALDRAFT_2024378 [Sodiomyces alcalophilus JCM 7366]|uniref:uncharacterized protein n=1 Tax=Sodiomyces alcalophilus JCM 7366 TaxID=591952 RepID=UPI0039B381AE